jgi:hypothetical protein
MPWYSSFRKQLQRDFHAAIDPEIAPVEYNCRAAGSGDEGPDWVDGRASGPAPAFLPHDDRVFHPTVGGRMTS